MERRTSCLQSNVEFLQQALAKQARETKARLDAAEPRGRRAEDRDRDAQGGSRVAAGDFAELKKPEPAKDKK